MTDTPDTDRTGRIDPQQYRNVLGQYPTGVCVITAEDPETGPSGMVIGSFTSVSLDPPLIAFFPAKTSTSWPKIEATGHFCVNILGSGQEDLCRTFFSSSVDKFSTFKYRSAESGAPVIEDVVAWIDCDIEKVQDAGDHYFVLGRVRRLELERPSLPLVFFQGGYGRFSPLSLAAPDARGLLTEPLRHVDLVRPLMEEFAEKHNCRCIAVARTVDEVVIAASAGQSQDDADAGTLVGQRMPFLPPTGSVFAAWDGEVEQSQWLRLDPSITVRNRHRTALRLVRERGYSLGMLSPAQREFASALSSMASGRRGNNPVLHGLIPQLKYDPIQLNDSTMELIRQVSAPVFDEDGRVALAFTVFGYGRLKLGIGPVIGGLLETASAATRRIGGRAPAADPTEA